MNTALNPVASIPSPPISWQSFSIGPLTIHTYALCIILGIVFAVWIASVRFTKRGGPRGATTDLVLWTVPLGIIGARFYHVFTHPSDYFYPGADPWRILFIWEGGNAIFGAIIGGAIGMFIGGRIIGTRFLSFADAMVPGMLVAQATGRLGNYFNHELFGLPTTLPWGLEIESSNPAFPSGLPAGTLFQPMFLYEIIWNLLGVAVILILEKRVNLRWGRALAVYLMWYGFGRAWLESIRLDPSETWLGIRVNSWAAIAVMVLGVVLYMWSKRRHTGRELSVFLPGREPAKSLVDSSVGEPARYHVGKVASSKTTSSSTTTSPTA